MIFVILGTQDKSFVRLLDKIQSLIQSGVIKEKVIVQAGSTSYQSNEMDLFDLIQTHEFNKLVKEANLIITHGGVGSIMEGIKNNKKIIAVPRLAKYKEHVNDHQIEIVNEFTKAGYIIGIHEVEELEDGLIRAKTFQTQPFKSNNCIFISLIEKKVEQWLK